MYILNDESEVTEIYFINEGKVGVSHQLQNQKNPKAITGIVTFINKNSYIFDYYVLFDKKSEFNYSVIEKIQAFYLTKTFLLEKILKKYPYFIAE